MRLVGASTLYIALPFLLEALVTAVIGVALAAGALTAFLWFGDPRTRPGPAEVHAVGRRTCTGSGPSLAIAILGPLLTLLPTLVLTRKYLKV